MNKKKIFNDPVYGFISFPHEILYDLINHPYFQRLRRISQMGLSHYVYPGALHTRFHHALGSLHLITQAIAVLREKGVRITQEESKGVSIAILLHDIGHGPFSHALEGFFVDASHEELSLAFMEVLNDEFNGQLELAMKIFKGKYQRRFLHQLVSSQLDMDRMDYLNRDSFFTGVAEGVISYDRIIKMLNVVEEELVVEEKGIFSIEKFILSRKLMYWQVYLHKTSIISEQMLLRLVTLVRSHLKENEDTFYSDEILYFLRNKVSGEVIKKQKHELIEQYAKIDDLDMYYLAKRCMNVEDFAISFLAKGLMNRRLLKIDLRDQIFPEKFIFEMRAKVGKQLQINDQEAQKIILIGQESNLAYNDKRDEIKILYKDGQVKSYSEVRELEVQTKTIRKYFMCYPKF